MFVSVAKISQRIELNVSENKQSLFWEPKETYKFIVGTKRS
jgi:hypothetical protein